MRPPFSRWSESTPTLVTGRIVVTIVLEAVIACFGIRTAQSDEIPVLDPGSVIRWHGVGIERCSNGAASWRPIGDTCWYPIDLLLDEGPVALERVVNNTAERTTVRIAAFPFPQQDIEFEPTMVNPPQDQLERIRTERTRVSALWNRDGPAQFSLPLSPPLTPVPVARSFGFRRVLNGEPRNPHSGVDYSAPAGTPVLAAARGTVVLAEQHYFAGKALFIDHGDQLFTMYFHLSEISVNQGDLVVSGQVIGAVGATGRVTGPHLHFGVRWHGARIDPTILLRDPDEIPAIGE